MKEAVKFLGAFSQAMAALSLYNEQHPSRTRAVDLAFNSLTTLQSEVRRPSFSFLGDEVVFMQMSLQSLKDWPWGMRLASVGVQRVEFRETIGREEFEQFLSEMLTRLSMPPHEYNLQHAPDFPSIRFGAVGLRTGEEAGDVEIDASSLPFTLEEETQAVSWLQQEMETAETLPLGEAEAVVRSLSVAMRGDQLLILPLLRLRASAEYKAIHAINVSVLAMACAGELRLADRDVHAMGLAGLLYDLGMARLPRDLVNKEGALTDEERRQVQQHPEIGARLILRSDRHLDLAAAVAYEHHIRPDGTGYPETRPGWQPHFASKVIRLCDVYDALRTERPYRQAWEAETALYYLDLYAGTEFDADIAHHFTRMMRRIEAKMERVRSEAAS